jgi:hypothetical protein
MFSIRKISRKTISVVQIYFAIWGPDRVDEDGGAVGNTDLGKTVNPHVIFKFSWGNKLEDEKLAVDDMSLYAGVRDYAALGRPNVTYLIKAKRKGEPNPAVKSPVHGFDVYEVRQGERIANPTLTYVIGGDEDVAIEVAPGDMGLPLGTNPFSLSLAAIRRAMERVGVVFGEENQE